MSYEYMTCLVAVDCSRICNMLYYYYYVGMRIIVSVYL